MLNFEDEGVTIQVPVARASASRMVADGTHVPVLCNGRRPRCCVCQLEVSLSDEVSERGIRDASVGKCGCDNCFITAHTSIRYDSARKIHT